MIVGVTGYFGAGKDTVAALLEKRSFCHISLSDLIREEIRRRGEKITIPRLTEVGNALRREHGPQVLAELALERIDPTRNYVITSIRSPGEIAVLRRRADFVLLFVDASQAKRFERTRSRARRGDPQTLAEFKNAEKQQMESGDPAAQQLLKCREAADIELKNDGTAEALEKRIAPLLQRVVREFMPPRPTWHEYFMAIAEVAATRSNCLKRRIGAILVKDKQIVSTGYNGTPKGIKNCDEGGCPRSSGFGHSGHDLGECLCVHAEENEIVQAACNGISIQGSTLYSTLCPCLYCAKSIINAGIKSVVYRDSYSMDQATSSLFLEAKVELIAIEAKPRQGFATVGKAKTRRTTAE